MVVKSATPDKEITIPQVKITPGSDGVLGKDPRQSGTFYDQGRILRRDPTVKLARALAAAPILAAQWSVVSTDLAPEGAKELIERNILPMRHHYLSNTAFGCMDWGFQAYEKVWTNDVQDGSLVIKKLKPLLPDITKALVDPNGNLVGLDNKETQLPIESILWTAINVEGTNWYGEGMLKAVQPIVDAWKLCDDGNKKYDQKIAGAHWVVYYPMGSSTVDGVEVDNYSIAVSMLTSLESNGHFILPRKQIDSMTAELNEQQQGWEVDIKAAYPTSGVAFLDRLKYLDAMKVRCFEIPERAITEGQFGTKAEAEAHADFAITNMELRHARFLEYLNWHVVNQIILYNYGEGLDNCVSITAAPLSDTSLLLLKEVYKAILQNPQTFLMEASSVDLNALRTRLGIPTLPEGEQNEFMDLATETETEPGAPGEGGGEENEDDNAPPESIAASLVKIFRKGK
jgi:hypothetical protein